MDPSFCVPWALITIASGSTAQIIDLFRALTGREPTPEEVEEARAEWDQAEQD